MMAGLTNNEAALILCICGVTDPMDKNHVILPTVEESLRYMDTGVMDFQQLKAKNKPQEAVKKGTQLRMFG